MSDFKDYGGPVLVTLDSVLEALNQLGLYDALLRLDKVRGYETEKRLLALNYARNVEHLSEKVSVKACNDINARYANDEATEGELDKAVAAAEESRRFYRSYQDSYAADAAISAALAFPSRTAWCAEVAVPKPAASIPGPVCVAVLNLRNKKEAQLRQMLTTCGLKGTGAK